MLKKRWVSRSQSSSVQAFVYVNENHKPFDPRVLLYVSPAVAQAAVESGVARKTLDLAAYGQQLEETVTDLAQL